MKFAESVSRVQSGSNNVNRIVSLDPTPQHPFVRLPLRYECLSKNEEHQSLTESRLKSENKFWFNSDSEVWSQSRHTTPFLVIAKLCSH